MKMMGKTFLCFTDNPALEQLTSEAVLESAYNHYLAFHGKNKNYHLMLHYSCRFHHIPNTLLVVGLCHSIMDGRLTF